MSASFIFGAVLTLLGLAGAATAADITYPERPVRIIVPFATGGGTDIIGRSLAAQLARILGKPFVVENRPGASAMLGAELVAKSPPDGYTILLGTSSELTIAPTLFQNSRYNPVADFRPIALIGTSPNILLANSAFPAKNLRELVAMARAKPGKFNYASGGTGTGPHLSGELLKSAAGIDIVHVAYKGTGPALTDLLGNQVDLLFCTLAPAIPYIKSNKVKAIGVTSAMRTSLLPDIPTMAEQGLSNVEAVTWYAALVPSQTPNDVVEKLQTAIDQVLRDGEFINRLQNLGIEAAAQGQGGEVLHNRIRDELAKWGPVIKESGVQAQ